MQQHNQQWNIILLWMLATVVGSMIGILSILTLVSGLALAGRSTVLVGLIGGTALGGGLGVAQWLVLRRHVQSTGWWIVVSGVGWMTALGFSAGIVEVAGV